MVITERNNMYRNIAQTLEWIEGNTGIVYVPDTMELAPVPGQEFSAFIIVTNHVSFESRMHPMSMNVTGAHLSITGNCGAVVEERQPLTDRDMIRMDMMQDNGGYSTVNVQFIFSLVGDGEHALSRHFRFRNNMLFKIR